MKNEKRVIGIIGDDYEVCWYLSNALSLPYDDGLIRRVVEKTSFDIRRLESLIRFEKSYLDEIEETIDQHPNGVILDTSPINVVSRLHLSTIGMRVVSDTNTNLIKELTDHALNVCNRFTHIICFTSDNYKAADLNAHAALTLGFFEAYRNRIKPQCLRFDCFSNRIYKMSDIYQEIVHTPSTEFSYLPGL